MSEEEHTRDDEHTREYWKEWYLKHHPHAILIHFPIGLHFFASGLDMIFLFNPKDSFATAIFYTFFVAILSGAVAMVPGIFSWWVNYKLAFTYIFIVKLVLSLLTLLLGIIAILIYLNNPQVVFTQSLASMIYHGIVFVTMISIAIVGYYGAKLTWHKKSAS